jgi:hypothetical protein
MSKNGRVAQSSILVIVLAISAFVASIYQTQKAQERDALKHYFAEVISEQDLNTNYVTNNNGVMNDFMSTEWMARWDYSVTYAVDLFTLSEILKLVPSKALETTVWCGELPNITSKMSKAIGHNDMIADTELVCGEDYTGPYIVMFKMPQKKY